ncbi:MAG: nitroreductase family deazaflavin-dependent oxidoreductase [Actinomycetota bacterium]
MSVLDELGYEHQPANAVQRVTQRIAASGPGAWVAHRTLYPIDRWLYRRTDGKTTLAEITAGLPVILLTTTGAKSGQPRAMPLVGIPLDGEMAIIGSNYGQERTPGWVYNLEADPSASVGYRDRTVAVVARRADDDTADRVFEAGAAFYPGYAKYRGRASHRTIRVFVLDAAG